MSVAIASVGVNVVVSVATVERLGLAGLALGIAVGAWFEAVEPDPAPGPPPRVGPAWRRSCAPARSRSWAPPPPGSWRLPRLLVLPVPAGTAASSPSASQLLLASAAALLIYIGYSRVVRLPELPRTVGLLRSALRPG